MTNKSGPVLYSMGSALDLTKDLPLFQRETGKPPRKPKPTAETFLLIEPTLRIENLCQDGIILYIGLDGLGDSTHPLKAECFEAWTFQAGNHREQKPSIFEPVHRVSPELGLLKVPGEEFIAGFYTNLRRRDDLELREFIMHLHRTPKEDLYRVQAVIRGRDEDCL